MEDALMRLVESVVEVSPHVWDIAVRQAYVDGIVSLFSAVFVTIIGVVAFLIFRWGKRAHDAGDDDSPLPFGAMMFSTVALIFLPIALWESVTNAIGNLANPEFAAIRLLLKAAGVE